MDDLHLSFEIKSTNTKLRATTQGDKKLANFSFNLLKTPS